MFNIIESDKFDGYYFYESAKEQQNSILFKISTGIRYKNKRLVNINPAYV